METHLHFVLIKQLHKDDSRVGWDFAHPVNSLLNIGCTYPALIISVKPPACISPIRHVIDPAIRKFRWNSVLAHLSSLDLKYTDHHVIRFGIELNLLRHSQRVIRQRSGIEVETLTVSGYL